VRHRSLGGRIHVHDLEVQAELDRLADPALTAPHSSKLVRDRSESMRQARDIRRRIPRGRDRREGSAMLEAAIALPVFVLVLIALGYIHRMYAAQHAALAESRRTVWTFAQSGCETADAADGSPQVAPLATPDDAPAAPDIAELTQEHTPPATQDGSIEVLDDIPVVGALLSNTTPDRATHVATRSVLRPRALTARADGGAYDEVSAATTVLCNEVPLTAMDVAESTFTSLLCMVSGALCDMVAP
jgi:hypothetical protein